MAMDKLLVHMSAPYDPAKRHRYYEEHKHLKGRRPGAGKAPSTSSRGAKVIPINKNQHISRPPSGQEAAVQARVAAITKRLGELRAKLEELLKKAGQSSSPSKKTTTKKPRTSAQKAAQKKAAQKSAAKRHAKAASSSKSSSGSSSSLSTTNQIAHVREQIRVVESNLRAAVAEARRLAANSSKRQ